MVFDGTGVYVCVVQEQARMPVYHPTPSQTCLATQLTEEEQIRIAQRIGLIQHLPRGVFDGGKDGSEKKIREWVRHWGHAHHPRIRQWDECGFRCPVVIHSGKLETWKGNVACFKSDQETVQ